jgi:hypothetical protein
MKITRIVSVLGMVGVAASTLGGCSSAADESEETAGALSEKNCEPGGLYCAGGAGWVDKATGDTYGAEPNTLYRCDVTPFTSESAPRYQPIAVERCNAGCVVNPVGTRDACKATHSLEEATDLVKRFYGQIEYSSQHKSASKSSFDRNVLTRELDGFVDTQATWVPGNSGSFVCVQGEDMRFDVGSAVRDKENAIVPVNGGQISVTVRLSDLRIAGWRCGTPSHTSTQAHAAARKFYEAYASDGMGKPVDTSAMIASELQSKLDEVGDATHADPVLCAQDFPVGVSVDPAVELGEYVAMTVRERFTEIVKVTVLVGLDDLKFGTIACEPGDGPWASKDGM